MARMTQSRVTFDSFPKLVGGYDDDGAPARIDGVEFGRIIRIVDWRDVGACKSRNYKAKVIGYVVELFMEYEPRFPGVLFGEHESEATLFATLADARTAARAAASTIDDVELARLATREHRR